MGELIMNKENKLTDDTEIDVGMLEEALDDTLKEMAIKFSKDSYIYRVLVDTINLIHCLQDEIKEYETLFDISNERKYRKMFNEEWKKEYQKELDEQGESVIAGFPDFDLVYKLYFEQKAEIERLTEREKFLENAWHISLESANTLDIALDASRAREQEYKKQVDELKASNEHLDSENTRLVCEMDKMLDDGWDIMDDEADAWYKKGGKDTAKEILLPLIGCEKQIDPLKTGIRWSVLKGFCKKFDIEVE